MCVGTLSQGQQKSLSHAKELGSCLHVLNERPWTGPLWTSPDFVRPIWAPNNCPLSTVLPAKLHVECIVLRLMEITQCFIATLTLKTHMRTKPGRLLVIPHCFRSSSASSSIPTLSSKTASFSSCLWLRDGKKSRKQGAKFGHTNAKGSSPDKIRAIWYYFC